MAQVAVTIAGRTYRMSCGEGEEERLLGLGSRIDAKISELRGSFGEIGDHRITIMAALTLADELATAEQKLARIESDLSALKEAQQRVEGEVESMGEAIAGSIEEAAERIDRIAQAIVSGIRSA